MRGPMNLFLNRLFRAAKLDAGLYEEVIADPKTMFQAMMAVFIFLGLDVRLIAVGFRYFRPTILI
jgi:hypothetical protein